MAWGPVDYGCRKGCTAIFADHRECNSHEDECKGPAEFPDTLNRFLNEIATDSVNGGSE